MDKSNIITMSLIVIAAMGVIAFLMWKNKKDEKKDLASRTQRQLVLW